MTTCSARTVRGVLARVIEEFVMPEPTEVCGSAAVVRHGGVPSVRSTGTSCISNRWYRTPGQLTEIIRHTARRARGSTGHAARYTEELTRPWKGGVVCLPFPRRNCAKSRLLLTARAWGIPVRAVGRAYFGAVNMSASCKEVCRTRRTIEWSSLLQSRVYDPLSGPAKSRS